MERNPTSPGSSVAALAVDRFTQLMKPVMGVVYGAGYAVTCGRKCSACCAEPAMCTRQEAEVLAEAFRELPPEDQERVRGSLREWLVRFDAANLGALAIAGLFAYRAAKLPCPFLKNQECSVYESRPLCCRGHFALGPRESCEQDALRPDQTYVMVDQVMMECYATMLEHEDIVLDHIGIWLAELLLGEVRPSKGRKGLRVTNRPA